jgi:hypothetical protein
LEEIQGMRVGWCKAMPIHNGGFGAWISEQWLAFAKVLVWWMGLLDCAKQEDPYVEPVGDHTTWNKKQGETWLKARELVVQGNASEVKDRVASYMLLVDGPPPVVDGGTAGTSEVKDLVRSLYAVLSMAMTETVTQGHLQRLNFVLKRYLTDFERLDASIRPKNRKPRWVTTFNIAGLQNILPAMWWLGPIRNFWEGSFRGEGYLRFMKQEINMGLRLNWQVNLLRRMYRRMAMARLLDEEELEDWAADNNTDGEMEQTEETFQVGYTDFKCYSEDDLVEKKWASKAALSAMLLTDGTFRVLVGNRTSWYSLISDTGEATIECTGLTYGSYNLCGPYEADMDLVTHGCMFLPHLLTRIEGPRGSGTPYAIIRSDWKVWNGDSFADITL